MKTIMSILVGLLMSTTVIGLTTKPQTTPVDRLKNDLVTFLADFSSQNNGVITYSYKEDLETGFLLYEYGIGSDTSFLKVYSVQFQHGVVSIFIDSNSDGTLDECIVGGKIVLTKEHQKEYDQYISYPFE